MTLEELKKTPIVEVAHQLELNPRGLGGTQVINCLWHEDKHPSLVLMPEANRYECKSCDAKGSVIDLVMGAKKYNFKEAVEFLQPDFFNKAKKPFQGNYLESRGINQETIKKFGLKVDSDKVTIPLPTGEKYRSLSGTSRYWHKPGTIDCLFKTDKATKGVILAEGEFDAILTWQQTTFPVWTATCGVQSFKQEWVNDFTGIKKIYIAFDNDLAGDEGAVKAAELLGFDRCYRVNIPTDTGKDLTDFFISGKTKEDFRKLLLASKLIEPTEPTELKPEISLKERYLKEIQSTGERIFSGFKQLDNAISGFRPGGVYAVAGLEKCGKTALLLNILGNMLSAGKKVGYLNTELPFTDCSNRSAALNNKLPISDIEKNTDLATEWLDSVERKFFYIDKADPEILENNALSFEKTKEKMDEWREKGVDVIMLDNLTTYATQIQENKKGWEILASAISQTVDYAFKHKIVIMVVIHTTDAVVFNETPNGIRNLIHSNELEKIFTESATITRKPTLGDVYGGGVASSQLSGAFLIWRPFQKFNNPKLQGMSSLIIDSSRFGGEGQEIRMLFQGSHSKFTEINDPNNADHWQGVEKKVENEANNPVNFGKGGISQTGLTVPKTPANEVLPLTGFVEPKIPPELEGFI